jgi:hypothetical protein
MHNHTNLIQFQPITQTVNTRECVDEIRHAQTNSPPTKGPMFLVANILPVTHLAAVHLDTVIKKRLEQQEQNLKFEDKLIPKYESTIF